MVPTQSFGATLRRLFVPVAISTAIGIVAIGAVTFVAANKLNQSAESASVELLATTINNTRDRVKQITLDYAFWDQAVEKLVENFDRDWADHNVGAYLQDTQGIFSTYVVNPENQVVYASARGGNQADNISVRFGAGLEKLLDTARRAPRDQKPVPAEGLVWDGTAVHSVGAAVLTDYELVGGNQINKGTDWVLILTIAFNDEMVANIGKKLRLNNLRVVANEDIGSDAQLPLQPIHGDFAARLAWSPPTPGREMLGWMFPTLCAVFIMLAALLTLSLRNAKATAQYLEKQSAVIIEEMEKSANYLDIAEVIIVVLDNRARVVMINRKGCEVLGYAANELIGEGWFERIIPEDERDEVRDLFQKAFRGEIKPVREYENHVLTKSGERRLVSWRNNLVIGSDGEIIGSLGSGNDITEFKAMESQLRRVQKIEAFGQLTGGVAHHFNNLLTVVSINLQLLLSEVKGNPQLEKLVRPPLGAVERGSTLTQRLLSFSQHQMLSPRSMDPNRLVTGLGDMIRSTLGEKIDICIRSAIDAWPVIVDPYQFELAFYNLILNARDAMPDGGTLTVETMNASLGEEDAAKYDGLEAGDYVRLTIFDTGEGISPDNLEHVIEPFFTTKDVGVGVGLGLSMVYGFIRQSQGHITIQSEVGGGTAVSLYLPRDTSRV